MKQPILQALINTLDTMSAGIYIMSHSKIIYCNSFIARMFNCSKDEFKQVFDPQQLKQTSRVDVLISDTVNQTKCKEAGCQRLIDLNGNAKLVYTTQTPVFDDRGEIGYIIGYMQEIDQIRETYTNVFQSMNQCYDVRITNQYFHSDTVIYKSKEMQHIIDVLLNAATVDAPVLLQGETGVGKDVLANFLHQSSTRKSKSIVKINCAAIPASLFESELFGYEKGAFTGALAQGKRGLIEEADGGTLFLDEINSMPLEFQGKLLRTLDTKTIQRVGGDSKPRKVDFRLVAATNADLYKCVQEKTFRLDLFFRLDVLPVTIPPLRQRKDDIIPLTEHFLAQYCRKYNRQKALSDHALSKIMSYDWPGNIRELRNFIERLVLLSDINAHEINDFPNTLLHNFAVPDNYDQQSLPSSNMMLSSADSNLTLEEQLAIYEKGILKQALVKYGSQIQAAKALGMNPSTMSRRIAKYGLEKY
jgi:transcriptional regulator with PAS, ATPase and Fis domain